MFWGSGYCNHNDEKYLNWKFSYLFESFNIFDKDLISWHVPQTQNTLGPLRKYDSIQPQNKKLQYSYIYSSVHAKVHVDMTVIPE